MRSAILLLLIATSAIAEDQKPERSPATDSGEAPTESVAAATESAPDPDRVESMLRSAETRNAGCCDGQTSQRMQADRIARALDRRLSRPSTFRRPR